ncbi:MAG TPA: hypothetical protein VFP17_05140 [Solirubrobacterales bacterium]|nr:hypothetical protein [Solirubrobacterales bacterium]
MPFVWRASIAILIVCLAAAMVIGVVRLVETPTEILGDGFRGLPARQHDASAKQR